MRVSIQKYLSEIGRRGGRKSRRVLSPADARAMVQLREARRAYKRYHALCFWSSSPELTITRSDVAWVAEQLKRYGNRETWQVAERLVAGGTDAAH